MGSKPPTRLVVGIDFGTTYSGVAYSLVTQGRPVNNIHIVSSWPAVKSQCDQVKVPTKIWYKPTGGIAWGYDVPDTADSVEWFKLLLVEENDLGKKLQGSPNTQVPRDKLAALGKDVTTVIADYLQELWKYALEDISRRYKKIAEFAPLTVILTVPAIWPEYARNKMKQAAKLAGICEDRIAGETVVDLVSEPEAAAIATMSSFVTDRPDIKKGDIIVVLDLGGGTADAISYIVDDNRSTDNDNKSVPKFREVVQGDGSFNGAKFLDREFEKFIKREIGLATWNKCEALHTRILNESWEYHIKRDFHYTRDKDWEVDTIVAGKYNFTKEQIADCFKNSVIPGIKGLVKDQIEMIKNEKGCAPKVRKNLTMTQADESKYL